jgi:hypothetical protein
MFRSQVVVVGEANLYCKGVVGTFVLVVPISSKGSTMSLEEAILERVRHLPPAKQEEVLRFADGLQQETAIRMVPSRDRAREMQWIARNRGDFADKWVAVEGDRLVAADVDAQKVFDAAKAEGIESPFVVHIPREDLPFVAGW